MSDLDFLIPDPDKEYECYPDYKSSGMTKLMLIVLNAHNIPDYENYLINEELSTNQKLVFVR